MSLDACFRRALFVASLVAVGCGPASGSFSVGDESTDSGPGDSGSIDTGTTDTGSTDTGATDTGTTDTGTIDTGTVTNNTGPLWLGADAVPFVAFDSGDTLRLERRSEGYGTALAMEMEGIDGGSGATAVIRISFGSSGTQDVFGGIVLNDRGGGLWASNTFFVLQEQTANAVQALDGLPVALSAAVTDGAGTTIEASVGLVAAAP